jgi:hypothetical protein
MRLTSTSKSTLKSTLGAVRIQFQRVEKGKPIAGEQSTSITVDECTVHSAKQDVIDALEALLASEAPEAPEAPEVDESAE